MTTCIGKIFCRPLTGILSGFPGRHFNAYFQTPGRMLKRFVMRKCCLACTSKFGMFWAFSVVLTEKKRCFAISKT